MKKRICFIVNPISGHQFAAKIGAYIDKILDHQRFEYTIFKSAHRGHPSKLAAEAVESGMDIVVAVGGDGTINEVASQLVNTDVILGIIPCGSGNGLARDLRIPLSSKKALERINMLNTRRIDVGKLNQRYFFSIAGIGYDAKVAYDFNLKGERGLRGYVKACIVDYFTYSQKKYRIQTSDNVYYKSFFFITVCNSSEWGYNVKLSPKSSLSDGKLEFFFCKKPSFWAILPFSVLLLSNQLYRSRFVEMVSDRKIVISQSDKKSNLAHIDGDALSIDEKIEISLLEKALTVLY